MVIASGLLAIIVGAAFAALLVAMANFRSAVELRRDTRMELVAAEQLFKLAVDLETGLRGFVITQEERFLEPFIVARAALPETAGALQRAASDEPVEAARTRQIVQALEAYVRQYALPLVDDVRRDDPVAHSVETTEAGKARFDALRAMFDRFSQAERRDLDAREDAAERAATRALIAAVAGVAGSIVLILAFTGYLNRGIVHPVRRAAVMAARVARGDLSARMRETDVAEIGELERSFNVMAGSLETGRDELAALLAEQAALRRVATLVAQGVPAAQIFAAVCEEVGDLVGSHMAAIVKYEYDGSAIVFVGVSNGIQARIPVGTRWVLDDAMASAQVHRTRRSARIDATDWSSVSGPFAEAGRRLNVASTAASPILVEGRLWGAMTTSDNELLPMEAEERLDKFTELLATAIANAETRAELTASRARIVTAFDRARRQIERDLHDGLQQRLVSLGLQLRGTDEVAPSWVVDELGSILEDLREVSRGIHPAILAEGGLGPALRNLARRSQVPVEIDVPADMRFSEAIELAVYYVVSEALTNAVKHAEASAVRVVCETRDDIFHLWIRDDGIGGAEPSRGSGLIGLRDRVESLGGRISIDSSAGQGTTVHVQLPTGSGGKPTVSRVPLARRTA